MVAERPVPLELTDTLESWPERGWRPYVSSLVLILIDDPQCIELSPKLGNASIALSNLFDEGLGIGSLGIPDGLG